MSERVNHDGSGRPANIEHNTRVRVFFRSPNAGWAEEEALVWDWEHDPEDPDFDIVAYEVVEE